MRWTRLSKWKWISKWHNLISCSPTVLCTWCLLDRASLWWLKNKKPTRCHFLFLFYFLETQHVSGINMPISRSMRLYCWTTTLAVSFLVSCVLEFGYGSAGMVSGLPAEASVGFLFLNRLVNVHEGTAVRRTEAKWVLGSVWNWYLMFYGCPNRILHDTFYECPQIQLRCTFCNQVFRSASFSFLFLPESKIKFRCSHLKHSKEKNRKVSPCPCYKDTQGELRYSSPYS